jgi:hypothetical protein
VEQDRTTRVEPAPDQKPGLALGFFLGIAQAQIRLVIEPVLKAIASKGGPLEALPPNEII